MKKFSLTLQSEKEVLDNLQDHHLCAHEQAIVKEILTAIEKGDAQMLNHFNQFGHSLKHIYLNTYAYRNGLKFGFDEIIFDEYGWLKRAQFLETEDLVFGNKQHYGEHSTLTLGRGPNHKWTYGLFYSFGTAGGAWGLSVYQQPKSGRDEALAAGIADLKNRFTKVLGNNDTLNYKQPIITRTLADIAAFQNAQVQLTLF